MPRLVHLAPASSARSVGRSGVRGTRWEVPTPDGPILLRQAVFAMPVVQDFARTHQWVRELRRYHGQKIVAVHLSLPRNELVYVGRYARPHELIPLGDAIGWVQRNHAGAEIVIPRKVSARETVGIRDVPQLVGWVETPEARSHYDCVCVACMPPGQRDLQRRVRAAYQKHLREAHAASDAEQVAAAVGAMGVALERARGQISPRKLLVFARSDSEVVRRSVACVLSDFRAADVEPTLLGLAIDPSESVRECALQSLLRVVGAVRAATALARSPAETVSEFVALLDSVSNVGQAVKALGVLVRRPDGDISKAVERTARLLLAEGNLEPSVQAALAALLEAKPE